MLNRVPWLTLWYLRIVNIALLSWLKLVLSYRGHNLVIKVVKCNLFNLCFHSNTQVLLICVTISSLQMIYNIRFQRVLSLSFWCIILWIHMRYLLPIFCVIYLFLSAMLFTCWCVLIDWGILWISKALWIHFEELTL